MSHDHHHHHQHHHHHHGDDFDWEAMADQLELDAAMAMPIARALIDGLTFATALDLGCGPGVFARELATKGAVTAVDSNAALLRRVTAATPVEADLDAYVHPEPVDLIWASMILHHVPHPAETLAHLARQLRPAGTLVMLEFGAPPRVEIDGWDEFEAAVTAARNQRLGLDPNDLDWVAMLASWDDPQERFLQAHHEPGELTDRWLTRHVERGIEFVGDALPTSLTARLREARGLPVVIERRVITARRS